MSTTRPDARTAPPATDLTPAETWQRVVARVADHVIVAIACALVLLPLGVGAALLPGPAELLVGAVATLVSSAATVAYFTVLESRDGQTVGKRLVGTRVTDDAGRTVTLEQALRRNIWTGLGVLGVVPVVGGFVGGLATLVVAVVILLGIQADERYRRGWHDRFAGGTRVVRAG